MSSMYLLKNHNDKRSGEVVSVPFGEGKRMIAEGIACYWNGGQGVPTSPQPFDELGTTETAVSGNTRLRKRPPAVEPDQQPK